LERDDDAMHRHHAPLNAEKHHRLFHTADGSFEASSNHATDADQNKEDDEGADQGIDEFADKTAADSNAQFRQYPSGEYCAATADDDVAYDAEAGALHDLSRSPTCQSADDQPNDEVHVQLPVIARHPIALRVSSLHFERGMNCKARLAA
jgi:hypothetical protein